MATYPSVPVPDYPITESTTYDVIVTREPGKENRRSRHTTALRIWELTYSAIDNGDCDYLWNFFKARKGRHESFTFVHPETDVNYTARFSDDNISRSEIGLNLFDMAVNLIEVV